MLKTYHSGEESDSTCSTSLQSASTYSVSWREEWNAGAEPFRHYPPLPPMPTSTALPPKGSPSKYVPQPSPKVPDPPPISKAQVTSSAPFVDDATLDQIDEEVNLKASTPPLSCNKQDGLIASRRRPGWQTASAPELPRVHPLSLQHQIKELLWDLLLSQIRCGHQAIALSQSCIKRASQS